MPSGNTRASEVREFSSAVRESFTMSRGAGMMFLRLPPVVIVMMFDYIYADATVAAAIHAIRCLRRYAMIIRAMSIAVVLPLPLFIYLYAKICLSPYMLVLYASWRPATSLIILHQPATIIAAAALLSRLRFYLMDAAISAYRLITHMLLSAADAIFNIAASLATPPCCQPRHHG